MRKTEPATADLPVAIVGGGPTGITAAILLALHGVDSVIFERWPDIYAQPRAVHLDDEVNRVLGKLGVASQFAAISRPAHGLQIINDNHRVLARFNRTTDSAGSGFPQANLFDQPELERVLRDRLSQLPQATLRSGVEVVNLTQPQASDDVVRLDVRDNSTGSTEHVTARFVLGCDGANSIVRSAIRASMQDLGFTQRWLVVDVETTADLHQWDGVHQLSSHSRAGTYMRIGATRHRWEFQLLRDERAEHFNSIDALLPLIKPWTGRVPAGELQVIRSAEYTFRAQIADTWRSGSAFLLGDAAHLTPPFIGQGMGAGIRDAYNLSWKLADVLHGRRHPDAILNSYETERRPHAHAMIRTAIMVGFAMTGGGKLGDAARRVVLPFAAVMPGVARAAGTSETPRLRRSALITRHRRPFALEGRLCPNPVIDAHRRLDQLTLGYIVITLDPPDTAGQRFWQAFPAHIVPLDPNSCLGRWLQRGRSRAALIRPDGIVQASAPRLDKLAAMI